MSETGLKHFERGDLVLYTRTDWFPYAENSACHTTELIALFLGFLSEDIFDACEILIPSSNEKQVVSNFELTLLSKNKR
jgi:hypothetical protein|tara:strand:- start:1797 stop:2033 length:237 start_codon:yes stop_codon:yes gene_type:complete